MTPTLLATFEHALWAGVAALCFAVLFNVPLRALFACGLTGMLGHATRSLLVTAAVSSASASLVAAVVVSLFGFACGRRMRAPAVIFVIPGIIPLVPGALAFRAMLGMIALLDAAPEQQQAALASAWVDSIRTTLITAALATGVAVPSMLLRRSRPML